MPFLVGTFLFGQFKAVSGKIRPCIDKPDKIIQGFPTYKDTIASIEKNDPTVMPQLRELAREIVISHRGSRRIIGFEVHGHADFDLNPRFQGKPLERELNENEISTIRAFNARELLLDLIVEEGGAAIIEGIRVNTKALGIGSKCLKVRHPTNEEQRKQNRRVEFFLMEFIQQPAPPTPPEPPKPPEPGTQWRIRIKRALVLSVNAPIPEVPVLAIGGAKMEFDIIITDVLRKQKATYRADAFAASIVGSPVSKDDFPEGPERAFRTTSPVTLDKFAGSVKIGRNGDTLSNPNTAGFFFFDFEALSPALTIPKVLEVKPGTPPPSLPDLSPGLFPITGKMTMTGTPVPVQ